MTMTHLCEMFYSGISRVQTQTPVNYAAAFSPGKSTFWPLSQGCATSVQSRGSSVGHHSAAARPHDSVGATFQSHQGAARAFRAFQPAPLAAALGRGA